MYKNKTRQMARSILPSTRRDFAVKKLKLIRHQNRAATRDALRHLDEDWEPTDDVDLCWYPTKDIRKVVQERRAADKIRHFERWAVIFTADIPEPDGRLAKMRAILPKGLIGDHAISHLERCAQFERDKHRYGWRSFTPSKKLTSEERDARRVRLLQEVCRAGHLFQEFNRGISHHTVKWPVWTVGVPVRVPDGVTGNMMTVYKDQFMDVAQGPTKPRRLKGIKDIPAFMMDLKEAADAQATVSVAPYVSSRAVYYCNFRYECSSIFKVDRPHSAPTYTREDVSTTRQNPLHHPEWLRSVDDFLDRWEARKVEGQGRRAG